MKTLFKFAAALAAIAIIFSCTKENGEDGGKNDGGTSLNQDIEFTLSVSETDATSAKIRVTHNGEREDTWYWFVTTENDINKAISAKVEELKKEGNITLQKSTGKNITVKDLEAKTTYTFVVFGLSSEGEVYGTPADIEFTTKADITNLEESDEWTITYAGRENGEEIFTVKCDENSIYLFDIISEYAITDEEGKNYLQEYMLMMVDQIQGYIEYGYTMEDLYKYGYVQVGPGTLKTSRMPSDTYYVFAIGYDASGEPTGTYAATKFTIEPEVAEDAYLQWIGTYDLTDKNGLTYRITLHDADPNYMYAVTGWECSASLEYDFTNALSSEVYFFAYYNNGRLEFCEEYITALSVTDSSGTEHDTDFGLYGYCDFDGEAGLVLTDGSVLATAEYATGNITVNGVELEFQDGSVSSVCGLGYAAMLSDGSGSYFPFNGPTMLPYTLSKVEGTTQQSIMAPAGFNKNVKNSFRAEKKQAAAISAPMVKIF